MPKSTEKRWLERDLNSHFRDTVPPLYLLSYRVHRDWRRDFIQFKCTRYSRANLTLSMRMDVQCFNSISEFLFSSQLIRGEARKFQVDLSSFDEATANRVGVTFRAVLKNSSLRFYIVHLQLCTCLLEGGWRPRLPGFLIRGFGGPLGHSRYMPFWKAYFLRLENRLENVLIGLIIIN